MNWVLVGILFYILLQLAVGLAVSRRVRSEADYLVAGRRIGLALGTFSMFATWFGAESCVSAAGKFYQQGLAGGLTDPFGYGLVLLLMGLFLAAPLWRRGLTTLADLFRQRFSPGVERFAALLMAPTSVFWAAAQIRAFGQVLHASSDLGVAVCITLAAVVVVLYTCSGGLMADVVTDLVQGIVIILGLVTVVAVLGLHPDVDLRGAWQGLDPERLRWSSGGTSGWQVAELLAMTVCGSLVAQEVVSRVLATKSPEVARRSTLWGGGLYLAVGLIPAGLGLLGTQLMPGLADPEQILPALAEKYLPTLLYIVFVGALVSAILSTVDSTLLAASSLVAHNFVVSFRPDLPDRRKLQLARAGVVVFGVIAYGLALGSESIFELVQQANGVGSAGVFVLLVFGLFSRLGGARAGYLTLATGFGTWAWGTYLADWSCPYLVSIAASLLVFLLAALTERRPGNSPGVSSVNLQSEVGPAD